MRHKHMLAYITDGVLCHRHKRVQSRAKNGGASGSTRVCEADAHDEPVLADEHHIAEEGDCSMGM